MDCQSCKSLEPIVGGDVIIYYCHGFEIFFNFEIVSLMGRFCGRHKERSENVNEND